MTQEDKELFLKDISSRFPYGVKVFSKILDKPTFVKGITDDFVWVYKDEDNYEWEPVEDVKLFLRPMSSMTEEEKEELSHLLPKNWSIEIDKLNNLYFDMCTTVFLEIDAILYILNWLLSRHFDYCGLIEKGLAIKVTEENNPYEA